MWELQISYRGEHTPAGLPSTNNPLLKMDCKLVQRNARMVETNLKVLFWILPQVSDVGCDPLIQCWAALNCGS